MQRPLCLALFASLLCAPAVAAPAQPEAQAGAPLVSLPQAMRGHVPAANLVAVNGPEVVPATAAGTGPGAPAIPVTLRPRAVVSGDVVRLGDLFAGPMPRPDIAVAQAPGPDAPLRLDANWLTGVARDHGLSWQPLGPMDSIEVTREGRYIGNAEILAALTDALAERGMAPDADVDVMGSLRPILVAADSTALISVIDASYDARSGRFSAVLDLPDGASSKTLQISGRTYETIEVPVLRRGIARDGMVTEGDIEWRSMRGNQIRAGIVTDPADLIGMAAQRSLRPGEPVRVRDVAEPDMVEKGQTVTMILKTPMMTLTARARALESGPIGASVRVQNDRSNKTVIGTITAERTVVVDTSQAASLY